MKRMIGAMLIASAMSLTACTPQSPSSGQPPQRVASDAKAGYVILNDTPYFKNGPAQPMPADGTIRAGTAVTVGKKIGSYTLVRTPDGTVGYVKTSDIATVPFK